MKMKEITPKQLLEKLNRETVCILDVRAKEKYEQNHLKHEHAENINIPKATIFALEEDEDTPINLPLSKDKEIIVTCTTGNSARKCAKILSEKGYNVTLLEGGMTKWNNDIM